METMHYTDYNELCRRAQKNCSKYGNKKTVLDGITFDSQREANRYAELNLLQRGGIIKNLERQKAYALVPKNQNGRAIKYVADFVYIDVKTGNLIIEDVKSAPTKTRLYRLKKRLMKEVHGIDITEIE